MLFLQFILIVVSRNSGYYLLSIMNNQLVISYFNTYIVVMYLFLIQ
nr:MAG TPA: hypothetical protein [Caudoviricetes sp.]